MLPSLADLPAGSPDLLAQAAAAIVQEYRESTQRIELRCYRAEKTRAHAEFAVHRLDIGTRAAVDWTWEGSAVWQEGEGRYTRAPLVLLLHPTLARTFFLPSNTWALLVTLVLLCVRLPAGQTQWTRIHGDVPSARSAHAVSPDLARGYLVLFGGNTASIVLGDTWEWDGFGWLRKTPASSPPARQGHTLAYDAVTQRVLLFGGADGVGSSLADTWAWNGTTWTRMAPANVPPPRTEHAMTYDPVRQRIVLFGGRDGTRYLNDTWEWDGTDWNATSFANPPVARASCAMAFDGAGILLFGGRDRQNTYQDTWQWNGSLWIAASPPVAPAVSVRCALAFDIARGRAVLFGGLDSAVGAADATWEWAGTTWVQVAVSTSPSARFDHAAAFDPVWARVAVIGGNNSFTQLADVWTFDGAAWSLPPGANQPSARARHAMAFDRDRQQVVLFGGDAGGPLGDTWMRQSS